MNANAWAALGMSVTDASRPADWETSPRVCLIESEPHVSVRHAFIHQCSFQVPYPKVKFVLYFRFHCLRFIFCIITAGKLRDSCGWFLELQRNGYEKDFRRTCSIDHCLRMPWRKIFACPEEDKKCGEKSCTLAWTNPVLCFVFPLCILLFCPFSTVYLWSKVQGQGMDGSQRVLNGTLVPHGGLMSDFLCVFQGSAGAQPSREREDGASICFLGASGEPAGNASTIPVNVMRFCQTLQTIMLQPVYEWSLHLT